ncbi:MAG: ATP-grasp domain-containing protein [Chloroflexi bacterium]|nr:ATP-grasp domain-containing protein [Chloroflexota bacterium]
MEIVLIKSYTEKPWRSPETYQLIEDSLRKKWRVSSIDAKNPEILHNFLSRLKQECGGSIFAFNIAEYLDEKNKTGFLPALLEEWGIPHLGSSAESIAIGLDKARTKALLNKRRIPTPRYFVANREDADIKYRAERMGYPLIVKPIREGGHIGIRESSIVYDDASLDKIVNRIFDTYDEPALVEEYITGKGMREFSVGIIDGETMLFTPVEIDYEAMGVKEEILSYETAQQDLERIKPVQDGKIRDEIIDLSKKTFAAVGARDYSRVDLRMNHTGCYVLEINIMPGLGPHSFLPEAAKDIYALEYDQLIRKLVEDSMQRQKNG